jgi:hypothetical protein
LQVSNFKFWRFPGVQKSTSRIDLIKKIEFQRVTILNYFRAIFVIPSGFGKGVSNLKLAAVVLNSSVEWTILIVGKASTSNLKPAT